LDQAMACQEMLVLSQVFCVEELVFYAEVFLEEQTKFQQYSFEFHLKHLIQEIMVQLVYQSTVKFLRDLFSFVLPNLGRFDLEHV
jgi:hypothetical protein